MENNTDSDNSDVCTPPSVTESAVKTTLNLLPSKSRTRYEISYQQFMNWRKAKDIKTSFSENVFLAYFGELQKTIKPSSLWTHYSMLRSTLGIHNNVDISKYQKLKALLKRNSDGFRPKKSKTLADQEINRFLQEAPDDRYLFTKVALIIGVSGACRKHELAELKIDDIEDLGRAALIKIHNTKNKQPRSFTLTGDFYTTYKKYSAPSNTLFLFELPQPKCTQQPIGINKFGNIPKLIATHLGLKDSHLYTRHCFRRSSATVLVNAGGDITELKRHGGWKSTTVAESYIDESLSNKMAIANKILNTVNSGPSSTTQAGQDDTLPSYSHHDQQQSHSPDNMKNDNNVVSMRQQSVTYSYFSNVNTPF